VSTLAVGPQEHAMRPYTFFKHSVPGGVPSFELGEFASDAEAQGHALDLMAHEGRYVAIEVWDGEHEPMRLSRPLVAARSQDREGRLGA
jgi:hypothetical protein